MSAKIWMELEAAVKEARPDLLEHFQQNCRNKETITEFLDTNFPLPEVEHWKQAPMSRAPATIREHIHLWKSTKGLKEEDDFE